VTMVERRSWHWLKISKRSSAPVWESGT
jgi:hypothetical protein